MPTPEEVEVADLLLRKAASDLSAAGALARDPEQQDDVVGFHAQQAIEESLKAVLAVRGFEIPRTHDLDLLTRLVGGDEDELGDAKALSPWAVATRYDDIDATLDRREAVEIAKRSLTAELGRDDLVLEWTSRGIAENDGWQISRLYDAACEANARLEQPLEILRLRRNHHERMPSSSTYAALREAAEHVAAWGVERPAARAALEKRDIRGFVDALLSEDDRDLAWRVAVAAPQEQLDAKQWLRIAASREAEHPEDALTVYQAVADEVLETADRRAYADGVRILKKAAKSARAAGRAEDFAKHIAGLRERYRRRPTLIAMLDKAGFA